MTLVTPSCRQARHALLLAVLSTAACTADQRTVPTATDDWANATAVGMMVRSEVGLPGQANRLELPPQLQRVPVFRGSSAAKASAQPSGHHVVRHFRDGRGRPISLAMQFDNPDAPPSFIYQFENGKPRAIVSARYARVRGGWVRTRARITFLDPDGRVQAQVDTRADESTLSLAGRRANRSLASLAADAVSLFAPRPLYAEEEGQSCFQQYLDYAAASAALAAAAAAVSSCAADPLLPICVGYPAAQSAAFTAALAKWSDALDKLQLCRELAKDAPPDSSVTGSAGGGGEEDRAWASSLNSAVESFIESSIASGNYYCSADGSTCVYLAAS